MPTREFADGAVATLDPGDENAHALFAAILAGELPAAGFGVFPGAQRGRGAPLVELQGCMRALDAHVGRLVATVELPRPVILATGAGARRQPNLTALLALLLKRYGVPVLIHGPAWEAVETASAATRDRETAQGESAAGSGRVTTLAILLELGIEPSPSLADAQARLEQTRIAYTSAAVLAPGLSPLLDDIARPRTRWYARSLMKLIDPFRGDGYRVVGVTHPGYLRPMREFLGATSANALLLCGTEGEPFANPLRQTQFEAFAKGIRSICAEMESGSTVAAPPLPATTDAPTTAAWIAQALAGEMPVPAPIIAQLACCLNGARRAVTVV